MKTSVMPVTLAVTGLILLADKAMAFPIMLGFPTVPDGGSTALLLIGALGGLALVRRIRQTK
jgi:hypothetical protein